MFAQSPDWRAVAMVGSPADGDSLKTIVEQIGAVKRSPGERRGSLARPDPSATAG